MYQLNDKIAMTQLSNKYIAFFLRVSISVIFCLTILSSYAQDKEKIYMSMGYKQVVNEYRLVEVTIRTRVDGKFKPIQDAPIEIFMETEDDEILLASINSDKNGLASLVIDKNYLFFKNDEGKYTLRAKFNGNETNKKGDKKVKMRDFFINADFVEKESVKTINISTLEFIKDSLSIPINTIGFDVFVDRMFADLKIATGELIEGKATVSFPDDIPGDADGNLNIRILIDDKDYQIVELSETKNWGITWVKKEIKNKNATTISYVVFMIVSIIVIAIFGLLLSKRISNKS